MKGDGNDKRRIEHDWSAGKEIWIPLPSERGRDGKQGSRGKRLLGGLWERKTDDGLSHLR